MKIKPMSQSEQGMYDRVAKLIDVFINARNSKKAGSRRRKFWHRRASNAYKKLEVISYLPYRITECESCGATVGDKRHYEKDWHEIKGIWVNLCQPCLKAGLIPQHVEYALRSE